MGAPYTKEAPWRSDVDPASASSSSGSEAGVRCSDPGSLTGQKAEPVGMKLTLFLSGQENSGAEAAADCLELRGTRSRVRSPAHVQTQHRDQRRLPHLFEGFDLLAALRRFALEHVAVVGLRRGRKLGQRRAASAVCQQRITPEPNA